MKTAIRTILANVKAPVVVPLDTFGGLADATIERLRPIVVRVQALGLPLEIHPQLANTFAFAYEGALYSVSAVGPKEDIVVTVQGQIGAVTVDDLMHLLPDPDAPSPDTPAMRLSPLPQPRRHPVDVMEDMLRVLKQIEERLP